MLCSGKAKTTEGRAAFDAGLFEEYFCSCDLISFSVNINTLLDCFLLFGATSDSTAAILAYTVSVLCANDWRWFRPVTA